MENINERIKNLRKLLNLNQTTFAKAIGISQAALSDLEKGKSKPSIETLISISDKFNISIDWIIRGRKTGEEQGIGKFPIHFDKLYNIVMDTIWEEKDTLTAEFNIPLEDIQFALRRFIISFYRSESERTIDDKYIIAMLDLITTEDKEYILKLVQDIILFKYKSEFQKPDIS
ncbi:helix-turn-helix domain-containing protein [Ureibacillus massiliensis]|uniref:helix-turn-helix domain-containing protein n=1 Tax=Ureibacillus massiliensis TaxID=292806 RepID=UPI00068CAB32|nr:helix-turn-helix transcriptional regulator [Ureibacillus massiliensis]